MLKTRLTERLDLRHPVIQAPMAFAAGGKLAASVSAAGGLGLIGGAYGDPEWIDREFREAGNQSIGCGLITWAIEGNEKSLDSVLAHEPKAVFLSFGNPQQYLDRIRQIDTTIMCQVQTVRDAEHVIDCGVDIVIAQGSEAGGHGESRATMTLVPEIADVIAKTSADTLLCAAGGIGDGRGLAAALVLGADGAVCGSRFWASKEAIVHPNMLEAALKSTGDQTIRSSVMDIARELKWPARYTARVLQNAFTDTWHNDIDGLIKNAIDESARWKQAWMDGDTDIANTFVGEVSGLLKSIEPADKLLETMVSDASSILQKSYTG